MLARNQILTGLKLNKMGYTPINYSTPNDGLGDPLRDFAIKADNMFNELYSQVVFKVPGKDLSSNDYTDADQSKLSGIAAGAEVNVQSDLLQEDDTQDDFVKGKDSFFQNRQPAQIETYAGVNTFTLPVGLIVNSVLLVRAPLWEVDEWTQSGNILTITKTMTTGNRIQINFY